VARLLDNDTLSRAMIGQPVGRVIPLKAFLAKHLPVN
jgi:hypothetical protein